MFNPRGKFYLAPMIYLSPQILLSRKVLANTETEYSRYYKSSYQGSAPVDQEMYTTRNADEYIKKGSGGIAALAGLSTGGRIYKKWGCTFEAGYQWQNFSRLIFDAHNYSSKQVSSWYLQAGISYELKR